jgi:hypothetical protein
MYHVFGRMHSPHVVILATFVHRASPSTVEILTNYRRASLLPYLTGSSHRIWWYQQPWYIKNMLVPARSLISSCWSSGPMISQDPSPASTFAPSGGSRGNPYATNSPSWSAGMHIIRGGGLGWAETWSWAPLSESSQPLAEPELPAPLRALPILSGAHAART